MLQKYLSVHSPSTGQLEDQLRGTYSNPLSGVNFPHIPPITWSLTTRLTRPVGLLERYPVGLLHSEFPWPFGDDWFDEVFQIQLRLRNIDGPEIISFTECSSALMAPRTLLALVEKLALEHPPRTRQKDFLTWTVLSPSPRRLPLARICEVLLAPRDGDLEVEIVPGMCPRCTICREHDHGLPFIQCHICGAFEADHHPRCCQLQKFSVDGTPDQLPYDLAHSEDPPSLSINLIHYNTGAIFVAKAALANLALVLHQIGNFSWEFLYGRSKTPRRQGRARVVVFWLPEADWRVVGSGLRYLATFAFPPTLTIFFTDVADTICYLCGQDEDMTVDSRCDSDLCHPDWKSVSHHRSCCSQGTSLDSLRSVVPTRPIRRSSYTSQQRSCGLDTYVSIRPALHCLPPPGAPRLCPRPARRIYQSCQDSHTTESLAMRILLEHQILPLITGHRAPYYPWPTLDRDFCRAFRGHNVHWGRDCHKSVRCNACRLQLPSMRRFLLHAATASHIREGLCRLHSTSDPSTISRDPRRHFSDIRPPSSTHPIPTRNEDTLEGTSLE